MRTVSFRFILFINTLCVGFILISCKKDDTPAPNADPVITFIDPDFGFAEPYNTLITITGENFDADASPVGVQFNGVDAAVSSATATQIVTAVPNGATTGKLSLTIKGKTVVSGLDFTVTEPATISSIDRTSGTAGTAVTLTGANFRERLSDDNVFFNGVKAAVVSATATTLVAMVPDGAQSGKVSVVINGVEAVSTEDFILLEPTINSFDPVHGVPGSSITITGTNFADGNLTLNRIKINGVYGTVVQASSTQLIAKVPASVSGPLTINVGGHEVTSSENFEVLTDIPRDGLVAFYPFSGDAKDATANHLDGTPMNGPAPTADRFNNAGQAYRFDGIDDHIAMGNPVPLQISKSLTVSGWININQSHGGTQIIKKLFTDETNNPVRGFRISQTLKGGVGASTFDFVAYSFDGTDFTQFTSSYVGTSPLPTNEWISFTVVIDDKTFRFYQNGNLINEFVEENTILTDGTQGNWIISDVISFDGTIDDVAIYNRALTSDEVTQLHQQTLTKY